MQILSAASRETSGQHDAEGQLGQPVTSHNSEQCNRWMNSSKRHVYIILLLDISSPFVGGAVADVNSSDLP